MAVGETRTITATFPDAYPAENLRGKTAEFETKAKAIEGPGVLAIDDAFAKQLGLDSLDKLKDAVRERIARDHAGMSRQKVKRQLLDQLDTLHKFTPPPTLVDDEFNAIWRSIEEDLKRQNRTFADEGTTEEKAREEYRGIAERRVRLGLVLAEIGEKNTIKVTDEELSRAVMERARQVPGREQEVWDYYRKNPQAMAGIRAPIFEEKVVDFLLELAKVTDRTVTKDELFKEDEEDEKAG
jgi:trigger factor